MIKRPLEITIIRPPKQPSDQKRGERDLVYPTLLPDDDDEGLMAELTFYDAGSKRDPSDATQWIDIPGWNNDDLVETLWTETQEMRDVRPFSVFPRDTTITVLGNADSKVRASLIATEYDQANPDRWDRKPLASRPSEWRYTGNKWLAGGTYMMTDPTTGGQVVKSDFGQFNIRAELVITKDSTAAAYVDPDLYHDGLKKRLGLKFPHDVDEIKNLTYRGMFPGQRLGLKVQDLSKSFGHYVTDGLAYAYDWIEGIYWCPFDTTDDEKFKVTNEPLFTAEEIPGRMIDYGKWDVFLCPRRWVYRFHYRHQLKTRTGPVVIDCTAKGSDWKSILSWWSGTDNEIGKTAYDSGTFQLTSWVDAVTHYEVFFWGRPPCNFTPLWAVISEADPMPSTSVVKFFDVSEVEVGTVNLIWSETSTETKAHAISAGVEAEIVEKIDTGGLSCNMHVCFDSTGNRVKLNIGLGGIGFAWGNLDQVCNTSLCGPVRTPADNADMYERLSPSPDSDNFGIKALWDVIEESAPWVNTIALLRTAAIARTDDNSAASRIDMIPYGIGISPSKAGDLVGIIKIREKPYYIWRKTDEVIEEKVVGSTRGAVRFESRNADGRLEHFSENGWLAQVSYNLGDHVYDSDFCDQFSGPATRQMTHVGRSVTLVADMVMDDAPSELHGYATSSGDGAVQLDVPIFVMASKERAFNDIDWADDVGGTELPLLDCGANYNYRLRTARWKPTTCDAGKWSFFSSTVRNSY